MTLSLSTRRICLERKRLLRPAAETLATSAATGRFSALRPLALCAANDGREPEAAECCGQSERLFLLAAIRQIFDKYIVVL